MDEARASLPRLDGSTNTSREEGEAWIAAARGDRATLHGLTQWMTPGRMIAAQLYMPARAGDRDAANALAAEIDGRPAGPLLLTIGIYFCLCGAPFDLEVTPNLAARLDEAGLAWPPVEALHWPLKDW
jgi:adenylate cyclase